MTKRRCIYEDDLGACRRYGYGNPPLCPDHENIDENELNDLVDAALEHPLGKKIVKKANDVLDALSGFITKLSQQQVTVPQTKTKVVIKRNPRELLHFGLTESLTIEKIEKRKKELARLAHPDLGGSNEAMAQILEAAKILVQETKK